MLLYFTVFKPTNDTGKPGKWSAKDISDMEASLSKSMPPQVIIGTCTKADIVTAVIKGVSDTMSVEDAKKLNDGKAPPPPTALVPVTTKCVGTMGKWTTGFRDQIIALIPHDVGTDKSKACVVDFLSKTVDPVAFINGDVDTLVPRALSTPEAVAAVAKCAAQ